MNTSTPTPERTVDDSRITSVQDLACAVLERWWLVLACMGVALGWASYQQRIQTPSYVATATVLVDPAEQQIVKIDKFVQEDLRNQETLNTIAQSMQQRSMVERVIDSQNLLDDPRLVPANQPKPTRAEAVAALSENITVRLRKNTRLVDVWVKHTNPEIAACVANALAREFIQSGVEKQFRVSDDASAFLMTEAKRLKLKLQESETALQSYREKSGSVSLDQHQDIVAPKLRELSERVTAAKAERLKWESELAQLNGMGSNMAALVVHARVAGDETVKSLTVALAKAACDFAAVQQRYREKHPKYIQTAHEIQEFQSRLDEAVRQLPKTVAAGYEKARAGELVLDQALREQEAAALQLSRTAIDYNVLAREVETGRALFQSIMSRLKEASLTRTLPDARVRLTQEAIAPAEPLDSGSFGRWAKAVCGGFLLSVALALGLNSRDNRLKGVDQVERALRLPVLAAVPQTRRTRHSPLLQSEEDPAVVEAFRLKRAALQVGAWKDSSRIVLFTSSVEGEGKTFCSARYASSLAWQGFKTLIIDGDLRRPSLEQALFGDVSGNPGIVNVLTGETTLADAVRHTSVENLSCLTSGPVSANPAELLA